jgi:hypothetical protein
MCPAPCYRCAPQPHPLRHGDQPWSREGLHTQQQQQHLRASVLPKHQTQPIVSYCTARCMCDLEQSIEGQVPDLPAPMPASTRSTTFTDAPSLFGKNCTTAQMPLSSTGGSALSVRSDALPRATPWRWAGQRGSSQPAPAGRQAWAQHVEGDAVQGRRWVCPSRAAACHAAAASGRWGDCGEAIVQTGAALVDGVVVLGIDGQGKHSEVQVQYGPWLLHFMNQQASSEHHSCIFCT